MVCPSIMHHASNQQGKTLGVYIRWSTSPSLLCLLTIGPTQQNHVFTAKVDHQKVEHDRCTGSVLPIFWCQGFQWKGNPCLFGRYWSQLVVGLTPKMYCFISHNQQPLVLWSIPKTQEELYRLLGEILSPFPGEDHEAFQKRRQLWSLGVTTVWLDNPKIGPKSNPTILS